MEYIYFNMINIFVLQKCHNTFPKKNKMLIHIIFIFLGFLFGPQLNIFFPFLVNLLRVGGRGHAFLGGVN